jgi:hypothetical protein
MRYADDRGCRVRDSRSRSNDPRCLRSENTFDRTVGDSEPHQPDSRWFGDLPLIHNLLIDLDGSTAQSSCIMEARSYPPGYQVIGEYRDSYRFEDRWLFTRRIYTMFISASS